MAARESERMEDWRSVPSGSKSFSPRLGMEAGAAEEADVAFLERRERSQRKVGASGRDRYGLCEEGEEAEVLGFVREVDFGIGMLGTGGVGVVGHGVRAYR